MFETLFWLFLINATLLIAHEIDSAYWKEWEVFKLPGGSTAFILIHLPLAFFILWGLELVSQQTVTGLVISLLLSLAGIFAFTIHLIFIKKGRGEFKVPVSIFILAGTLLVSLVQLGYTICLF